VNGGRWKVLDLKEDVDRGTLVPNSPQAGGSPSVIARRLSGRKENCLEASATLGQTPVCSGGPTASAYIIRVTNILIHNPKSALSATFYRCSLGSRVSPMSSPGSPALQQLGRLNGSSPKFHDQLGDVLHGEEYKQCVPNLQGDDLAWLVDYLDKVCHLISLPRSPLEPA
jgi:hypothetical protein